ncbi:MAG TPA: DUF447 domain-containing protein [Desulfobacteria bacterium]|nr:DUF447 domain-containing protein [Desulfobacteria bacterium]
MNLQEAGIGEGISEVIVTTQSAVGMPNAAPVGIITEIDERGSETKQFIKLYKGSQTLENVLETSTVAANVTDDVVLFVKTALGHLSELYLSEFAGVPVLTKANAWIVFTTVLIEERSDYLHFQVLPRTVKINRKEVKAINRGRNAVIEAAVLATRLELAKDEEEKESMRERVAEYAEIVEKCGGRREKEAMAILREKCSR